MSCALAIVMSAVDYVEPNTVRNAEARSFTNTGSQTMRAVLGRVSMLAIAALVVAGCVACTTATARERSEAARHGGQRVTLSIFAVGGPATVGSSAPSSREVAGTVVLIGPDGKTRRIEVGLHPRVATLPVGRYHSYALSPPRRVDPVRCTANNGTFITRSGLSVQYLCQIP